MSEVNREGSTISSRNFEAYLQLTFARLRKAWEFLDTREKFLILLHTSFGTAVHNLAYRQHLAKAEVELFTIDQCLQWIQPIHDSNLTNVVIDYIVAFVWINYPILVPSRMLSRLLFKQK